MGKSIEATGHNFEIHPGDIPLDKATLGELGFKIYPTKGGIYALHPNGVAIEYMEGTEWLAEVRRFSKKISKHVYNVRELVEFCEENGKPIKLETE